MIVEGITCLLIKIDLEDFTFFFNPTRKKSLTYGVILSFQAICITCGGLASSQHLGWLDCID